MAYKNITAEEFKKIQDENPDAVVLDVRTPAEVRQGKISEATNLEVTGRNFFEDVQKLDKDKVYLVYCQSGGISRWPYKTA